jgi:hypothetical protein
MAKKKSGAQKAQKTQNQQPSYKPAEIHIGSQEIPQHALDELKNAYSHFQNYFPLLETFKKEKEITQTTIGLRANIPFPENTDEVFVKVVHLLNPEDWIQGEYTFTKDVVLPGLADGWESVVDKLQCPENQAYVDTLTVSLLSQLREQGLSPHFVKYYGALVGKANTYRYNISEEFQSYKNTKWFWKNIRSQNFHLRVFSNEKDRFLNEDETTSFMLNPEDVELLKDDDTNSELSEIPGQTSSRGDGCDGEDLQSIHSVRIDFDDSASVHGILRVSPSNRTLASNSDYEDEDDHDFYAEFQNMPVMLIFMEKLGGVLDSLVAEPYSEDRWTAWICQIIFALTQAQAFLELTHNDLHGNNIIYSKTEKEFLYYRTKDGQVWRLPTFGKIFYIIDYGRAILRVQGEQIISDDFFEGNDAAGQYNFGTIRDPKEPPIFPNPSFDLVRLTVSIFDALFSEKPPDKKGPMAIMLSADVKETVSPLYNLLWTWIIDSKGKNILHNDDGTERFPGFDLYKHISAFCKGSVPKEQIRKPIFEKFKYSGSTPEGEPIYPLFA